MALELHKLLLCEYSDDGSGPHYYNCWNLCREIYRLAGRVLPVQNDYIKDLHHRDLIINEFRAAYFERLPGPELFAIVTLKLRPKVITHMGCVVDKRRFIHINRRAGVMLTRLDNRDYKNKIEGFYKYVGNNSAKQSI